jgi:hypothetical protein
MFGWKKGKILFSETNGGRNGSTDIEGKGSFGFKGLWESEIQIMAVGTPSDRKATMCGAAQVCEC